MIDIKNAVRPKRRRKDGAASQAPESMPYLRRYTNESKRYAWLMNQVLTPIRDAIVNRNRQEIDDPDAIAEHIKEYAKELGADIVGVAEYDPQFTFNDSEVLDHTRVIAFGVAMKYDVIASVGPISQQEVLRVYHKMFDIGVRLAHYIGSMGYDATAHANGGELAHVPYAYLAGLGELGKHGSLISPELGSSFRLSAVSTNIPISIDGPKDFGIDRTCETCNVCTRFCPGEAIQPEKQNVNGVYRWHVDTGACEPYFLSLHGCKVCLMVCPYNGRSVFKEGFKTLAKDMARTKEAQGLVELFADRDPEGSENELLQSIRDRKAQLDQLEREAD